MDYETTSGPSQRPAAWGLLFLLCLSYVVATLDRSVIALLVEPIRDSLGISDTQIGLLQGPAFSLTYLLFGLPVGMLVDRLRRTRLLAMGISVWSVMTGLCGLAGSFHALFFARAGVGAGEATLAPTSYSLIADTFPAERQGAALGIFAMSGLLGTGLSMVVGGFVVAAVATREATTIFGIGPLEPWRQTFLLLVVPGLVLSLFFLAMQEPARQTSAQGGTGEVARNRLSAFYRRNASFLVPHHLAIGLANMTTLALLVWTPSYFVRVHGWAIAEVGLAVGVTTMASAVVGLWGGGLLSDRATRRGAHLRLLVCAGAGGAGIAAGFFPLIEDGRFALLGYGAAMALSCLPMGAGNAALQHIAPNRSRGLISSIFFLSMGLVAMFGPIAVALVSDASAAGARGIADALAAVVPVVQAAAGLLFLVSVRPYRRSLADGRRQNAPEG